MTILTPGHRYTLTSFEGTGYQEIQFIEKKPKPNGEQGELETVNDGTTNEEVLEVLIDRLRFMGQKLPSRENVIALTNCEQALMWLQRRTQERLKRGVEGKMLP